LREAASALAEDPAGTMVQITANGLDARSFRVREMTAFQESGGK
jgi:hypothetical protein